ncbi:MAG: PEP-CTERM sorting domain-containing protein [Verrucomicrobiota bacterium]
MRNYLLPLIAFLAGSAVSSAQLVTWDLTSGGDTPNTFSNMIGAEETATIGANVLTATLISTTGSGGLGDNGSRFYIGNAGVAPVTTVVDITIVNGGLDQEFTFEGISSMSLNGDDGGVDSFVGMLGVAEVWNISTAGSDITSIAAQAGTIDRIVWTASGGEFGHFFQDLSANVSVVPEPSSYALTVGLGALCFLAWRRRRG